MNNEGRTLLIRFSCGRCGAEAYEPYRDNAACSVSANVRSADVPQGWRAEDGSMPLLCDSCHRQLKVFLGIVDEEALL